MDLHPYDGVERRFRHTDLPPTEGLTIVARLLHLAAPPARQGLLYDLSFYSGGIGILDNLAITLPADPKMWATIATALNAKTPEEAWDDEAWIEDLIWLLNNEEVSTPLRLAAVELINNERKAFQSECRLTDRLLFGASSGVNDWVALWGDDTQLNYLAYSQG